MCVIKAVTLKMTKLVTVIEIGDKVMYHFKINALIYVNTNSAVTSMLIWIYLLSDKNHIFLKRQIN